LHVVLDLTEMLWLANGHPPPEQMTSTRVEIGTAIATNEVNAVEPLVKLSVH
jgi:hypothetical protein